MTDPTVTTRFSFLDAPLAQKRTGRHKPGVYCPPNDKRVYKGPVSGEIATRVCKMQALFEHFGLYVGKPFEVIELNEEKFLAQEHFGVTYSEGGRSAQETTDETNFGESIKVVDTSAHSMAAFLDSEPVGEEAERIVLYCFMHHALRFVAGVGDPALRNGAIYGDKYVAFDFADRRGPIKKRDLFGLLFKPIRAPRRATMLRLLDAGDNAFAFYQFLALLDVTPASIWELAGAPCDTKARIASVRAAYECRKEVTGKRKSTFGLIPKKRRRKSDQ